MDKNIFFRPERLKQLRKNADMTQKEFSKKIGCTMASLSAYENGSKVPPTQTLINLSSSFSCSIDWLFGLKDEPSNKHNSKPIHTYSEYIKLLFALQGKGINLFANCNCQYPQKDLSHCKGIAFYDPVIKLFLKNWQKTATLYKESTIDKTIYTAWQEKVLRDFHYPILEGDTVWEDFHHNYSTFSELPGLTEYDVILTALSESTSFAVGDPPHID